MFIVQNAPFNAEETERNWIDFGWYNCKVVSIVKFTIWQ